MPLKNEWLPPTYQSMFHFLVFFLTVGLEYDVLSRIVGAGSFRDKGLDAVIFLRKQNEFQCVSLRKESFFKTTGRLKQMTYLYFEYAKVQIFCKKYASCVFLS